jgi:pimeloyl-ACP methyl ester carboxylesterase
MSEPIETQMALPTGVQLHVRQWTGPETPFVLLHGLASNSRLWTMVARQLAAQGHGVVAVDQRGHGLSDKPPSGYDFATVTADLAALLEQLALVEPVVVGQSWGGNVVLEFGARYPGRARGLAFIDGGFLDLQMRPGGDWTTTAERLRPPHLLGTPLNQIRARIRSANPDWAEEGIDAVLDNFAIQADGTVRPWLTLENHMQILRALWEQRPRALYHQVQEPVQICVALDDNPEWAALKQQQVAAAVEGLARAEVHWFEDTHHDIHVHRPARLAEVLLGGLSNGFW